MQWYILGLSRGYYIMTGAHVDITMVLGPFGIAAAVELLVFALPRGLAAKPDFPEFMQSFVYNESFLPVSQKAMYDPSTSEGDDFRCRVQA